MRTFRLHFAIFFLLTAGLPALAASNAADAPHVHVQLVSDEYAVFAPDEIFEGLYFKLEPGWHIYWKNPGDAGEAPKISWTLPQGVHADSMSFPAPKRLPLGPLMDYGYEDEVLFPMRLTVASSFKPGATVHLTARINWLVCRESCIPGKADLALDIPVVHSKPGGNGISIALLKRFRDRLPKPLPKGSKLGFAATAEGFRLTVETGRRESEAVFFPEDQDLIDNPAAQKFSATAHGFQLDLKKDSQLKDAPKQLRGVIELSGGRAYEIVAPPGLAAVAASTETTPGGKAPSSTGAANAGAEAPAYPSGSGNGNADGGNSAGTSGSALSADSDGGGNGGVQGTGSSAGTAMPSAESRWAALLRATGLAFLGGILLNLMPCVFPVLFLKGLALAQSGQKLQAGEQTEARDERKMLRLHGLIYATGILVSFWILVGVLLGLRSAGSILGWGFQFQSPIFLSLMAGLLFFLGLSLAGQFEIGLTLTSAGGSLAQRQGLPGSFFTGVLAVIVATPCTAPLMGAAVGYALSQSALISFAVFTALALGLAAPYVALTLQPAWTRLLPRPGVWMEILKQATAVPIFATAIWLAWVLARAYGATVLAALLAAFLLLAMAGWFLGRWPAKRWATAVAVVILLAVVALSFYSQRLALADAGSTAVGEADGWKMWSAEAVGQAQAEGRPVFVDFTASWCLSCQVNERVALNQAEVQAAFKSRNVLLLKADWTRHDEAITQALAGLGRSGVPTYVLYLPKGKDSPRLLPEALTPGIVLAAVR
jgi:thiol:disulfide interchange protein DsbD